MAVTATSVWEAFASISQSFDLYWPNIFLGGVILFVLLLRYYSVVIDPQEPPRLGSRIPIIGHLIGILRHQEGYFLQLEKKNHMPAYTLPVLGGKLYIINSPSLAQSVFRNRNLSLIPFMVDFAHNVMNLSDKTMEPFKAPPFPADSSPFVVEIMRGIHQSMNQDSVHQMNILALQYVSQVLNRMPYDDHIDITDWWVYLRDLMTMATTEGVFGHCNPWKKYPSMLEDIWTLEGNLISLIAQPFPWLTAPRPYRARARIQKAMIEFYSNKDDLNSDVSPICKVRCAVERKYGIPDIEIGKIEQILPHVATTNLVPTFFWVVMYTFSQPKLVKRLAEEIFPVIRLEEQNQPTRPDKKCGRKAVINICELENQCPLLNSVYKEVIRIVNGGLDNRKVLRDTTITDNKGNRYLLKKDSNVQIPVRAAHWNAQIWGPDYRTFNPERFLSQPSSAKTTQEEKDKEQKQAYYPFGGGRHSCPGRYFALAEVLGTLGALILGFELIDPRGGVIQVPPMATVKLTDLTAKPVSGVAMPGKIHRKKGWEDVQWAFVSEQI